MTEPVQPAGKTTIAPDVLVTIARLTTLGVPGVSRLAPTPDSMDRIFKKGANEGVIITVENNIVYVDLFVILQQDINVREVGRLIQNKVNRAISEMVGMEVGKVNIHVEDIDYGFQLSPQNL